MIDKAGYSEVERRALRLLAEGWLIHNAQGAMRANSQLVNGPERIPLGRSTMARLRNLGLIAYVRGHAAVAAITVAGRRAVASFEEEAHA